jgi:hypothetical protein
MARNARSVSSTLGDGFHDHPLISTNSRNATHAARFVSGLIPEAGLRKVLAVGGFCTLVPPPWAAGGWLAPGHYERVQAAQEATDKPGRVRSCTVRMNLRVPRGPVLEFALAQSKVVFR